MDVERLDEWLAAELPTLQETKRLVMNRRVSMFTRLIIALAALPAYGCFKSTADVIEQGNNDPNVIARVSKISGEVFGVSIRSSRDSFRQVIPKLRRLPSLKELEVINVPLAAEDFTQIAKLELDKFSFSGCLLSRGSLKDLTPLKSLREIQIMSVDVDDVELANLSELPNLHTIDTGYTKLSGVCFRKGFNNLVELNLTASEVSDETVHFLLNLKQLGKLNLARTSVTERGFQKLTSLLQLTDLALPDGTPPEELVAFRKEHIRLKAAARAEGIRVPDDIMSPFGSTERLLNWRKQRKLVE